MKLTKKDQIDSNKSSFVQEMFNNLAKDYDKMNWIMTLGTNKSIKQSAINKLPIPKNGRILDVCTGTGDMAIFLAEKHPELEIVGADFSPEMLEVAKKRSKNLKNITFIEADALDLPFENDYFDGSLISFGLRNLNDFKKGIQEMQRVTKQDGFITNIDLGKPNIIFNLIFRPYFFGVVPFLGKIIHGNHKPYQYLPSSSETFLSQEELIALMQEIGLKDTRNYDYIFGAIAQQAAKV